MAKNNFNKMKKCPRCGSKMHILAEKCANCSLVFSKIQNLSNAEAKKNIKEKKMQNVLRVYSMPQDVNKIKFWLFFFIFGWFGAHNIYVGNFKKGYYSLITGIVAILMFLVYFVLETQGVWYNQFYYYVTSPCLLFFVFGIIIWFLDCLNLIFRQYRYPASLTAEDYEKTIAKKLRGY